MKQQETVMTDYDLLTLKTATFMLETTSVQAILVTINDLDKAKHIYSNQVMPKEKIVWATQNTTVEKWLQENEAKYVCFPHKHSNPLTHLAYYVVSAVTQHFIAPDDTVLCLTGKANLAHLNQLHLFKPTDEFEIIRLINWNDVHPQLNPKILLSVIDLALAMGSVRHAYVRGTMISIGDAQKVLQISKPFIFEPFQFYKREKRNITDPSIHKTFEKYTRLDGAFVVSWDGTIEAVVQTINAPTSSDNVPKGLGSRHTAAGAISLYTNAYVIVVSQSAGNVSVFKDGRIVLSLKSY